MNRKVLINTDPGIDDCLALILAINSKDALRIEAINACYGNISAEQALANVQGILGIARFPEPLPLIGKGVSGPAGKTTVRARGVHGADGLGGIGLPLSGTRPEVKEASVLIEECLERGVDTIISLAPLTDLARAFGKNKDLAKKIDTLFIMGGALRVPGSINRFAEFNFYSDPEAADFVLNSGVRRIILVSFDVTTKVVLKEPDLERFKTEDDPLFRFIGDVSRYYIDFHKKHRGIDGAYMHDPLTVGLAIDEGVSNYEDLCLGVDCKKDMGRLIAKKGRPNVRFANGVDADRFMNMFLDKLAWR